MNFWGTGSLNGLPPKARNNQLCHTNIIIYMLELKELRSRPLTHTTFIAFALVSVCFSLDKFCCSAVVLCYATLQPSSKQLHSKGHSQSETTTVSERQGLSDVYSCLQRYLLVVEGMDRFVC